MENDVRIVPYDGRYEAEVISLILNIQNGEAKLGLTLSELPDLLDIIGSCRQCGGAF